MHPVEVAGDAKVTSNEVNILVKDGKFTITGDANAAGITSKSGKTLVIASTHGFVKVGDLSVSLNIIRKP